MSHNTLLLKIDAIKTEIDQHRPFSAHMQQQPKEYFRKGHFEVVGHVETFI